MLARLTGCILSPALLITASPLLAQSRLVPDDDAGDDDPITVTALPPSLSVQAYGTETVAGSTLQSSASGTIEGALARIAGFQQFRRSDSRSANPSAQGVTLRALGGNASSRTLILLDGVPVADPFFGSIPFAALSAEPIATASITRGSGTGPFGAGALTGVIALDSLALAARPRAVLALAGGGGDAWDSAAALVAPLGSGHVAIDLHQAGGDGFYTTPADQRVAATVPAAYRARSAALTAQARMGLTTAMTARVSMFRDQRTLRFAGADSRAEGVDASLRLVGSGRWRWEALGWIGMRDFSNIVVSATTLRPTLDQRATPSTGWGAKWEVRPPVGDARMLRLGVDVRGSEGEAIEDGLAPSGLRATTRRAGGAMRMIGGFVEGDARFGAFTATLGARIDHWRLSDGMISEQRADVNGASITHFVPRAGTTASVRGGLVLAVGEGLSVRAAAYSGFRLPTLNELYRGFTIFPIVTRANAALDPERLYGAELGAEWRPFDGARISLTGFDNRLDDAIANVTIGANLRQRQNVEAISSRGLEAAITLGTGPWRWEASGAYAHARVRGGGVLDGLRPAQSPAWSGSASLGWVRGDGLVQLSVRHVGAGFEDDRNADRLAAATTMDAVVRVPLARRLVLELRGENLGDAVIITRNSGGSIDLGTPRTLWLGLRWTGE